MEVRPLTGDELALADSRLPLSRLDQAGGEYLVAWEDGDPVGHAFLDWRRNPPDLQDVYVADAHRRRGIAQALTTAAEQRALERGHDHLGLEVSEENVAARTLYEKLGYRPTGASRRVSGTIVIRGAPLEVDDTLLAMSRRLDGGDQ
jgi:GNAT superfamily N-acetyltransferase